MTSEQALQVTEANEIQEIQEMQRLGQQLDAQIQAAEQADSVHRLAPTAQTERACDHANQELEQLLELIVARIPQQPQNNGADSRKRKREDDDQDDSESDFKQQKLLNS